MKKFVIAGLFMLFAFSVAFAEGGGAVTFGTQFADPQATKTVAEDMGIDVSSDLEMILDIRGWAVMNHFVRLGAIVGGGFFDAKGKPADASPDADESGVGFGDARFAIMPEIYGDFGKVDAAFGLATGVGAIITFVNDDHDGTGGDIFWYGFVRPQATVTYSFGFIGVTAGMGYHIPFGGDGEIWFIDEDNVEHDHETFDGSEVGGFFVKAGIVFGDLHPKKTE